MSPFTITGNGPFPAGVVSTLTGDFTVSAWVKFDALQNNQRLWDFGTSNTNYMMISQNTATTLRYAIKVGTDSEQGITSTPLALTTGKWVLVTVTQAGATTTLYINGAVAGSTTAITFRPSGLGNTSLNYFGKSQFADPMLKGTLDDVRIYSRALSAAEVASIVNGSAPAAPTTLTASSAPGAVGPISLNWTASPAATTYNVKRSTVAGGPYTALASNVLGVTYTDTTVAFGLYYYVVTSVAGAFEGVPSNEAAVVLLPANIPSAPVPVTTGWNGRIDLSWPAATGAVAYDIKRATVSGGPYAIVASVPSTVPYLTYSDTGVTNGVTYYYVVAAVSSTGVQSAFSSETLATIP